MRSWWSPSTHPTPWQKQSCSGCPAQVGEGAPPRPSQLTCSGHGSSGAPWCPTILPASLEGPLEGWAAGNQAENAARPSEGPGSVELVGPPQSGRGSTVIILQAACHQESRRRRVLTPPQGRPSHPPAPSRAREVSLWTGHLLASFTPENCSSQHVETPEFRVIPPQSFISYLWSKPRE